MTAIIEAAARALRETDRHDTAHLQEYFAAARAVLAAVTPLIEDAYARKLTAAEEIARKGNEYVKGWKLLEDDGSVTTLGESAVGVATRALQDAGDDAIRKVDAQFYAAVVITAVTPLIRASVLEEAAGVADKEAATYDALIEQGKGEYGKPSYVRDDTWNSWLGKYSVAMSIASDVRALKPEPSA